MKYFGILLGWIFVGMIVLPLIFPQGFSQCIYNDDWSDAPCFDMGPVSHSEFNKAWALYYDYKGKDWMEAKRIEMNQALEQGVLEEWVKKLENHNVYQYYLSRNEIHSLPYDRLYVKIDPNFVSSEQLLYEPQYRIYLQSVFESNSIFVFVPMMLGIVGVSLLIAHLILKKKKKPSRPYLVLIIAGFLLYFGVPNAVQSLLLASIIGFSPHLQTLEIIIGMMSVPLVGISFTVIGILLITKPYSVRQLYMQYLE